MPWDSNSSNLENPMTAAGDLIVGSTGGDAAKLAIGTSGQVPTVNAAGTALEYTTISGGGLSQDQVTALILSLGGA